jgi:AraC family transcriptional regulator of adaptative response / DNA-3-methyladenine glycosylase II
MDDTDFTMVEIAFMSGFGSVRQFNRACLEVFRASPRKLRARRRIKDRLVADGGLMLRLAFQPPLDWERMLNYFATRAIPGVEAVADGKYRRTVVIDGDPGVLELAPGGSDHLLLLAHIPHWEGLIHIAQRARHIFNLDADVPSANRHLAGDPLLKHLVSALPGARPPGTWDGFETGVQAILGQRVSRETMRMWMARVASGYGAPVAGLQVFGLKHTFPSAATLATVDIGRLGIAPLQAAAVKSFAQAVTAGTILLDGSQPLEELMPSLRRVAGVGPVTAHYIAFRLGEPDAFPISPDGLRRSIGRIAGRAPTAEVASRQADRWRPWRAHAAALLRFGRAGERSHARVA